MNDRPAAPRRYQDEVPAVARACRLLERLTGAGAPRSLADLSRDLGIGASSLLAILTTLRRAGLVARDGDGRYRPGTGLAALGLAACRPGGIIDRFSTLADALADRFGETVLLWVRSDDTWVLAAAREGTRPLRYVPTLGLRRAAGAAFARVAECAAPVPDEPAPGVWSIAVPLPPGRDAQAAVVALAGSRERLRDPTIRSALIAASERAFGGRARGRTDVLSPAQPDESAELTDTPASWEESGPIEAGELDAFLRQSLVATLSYVAEDGYPATVPLWYVWDGSAFWLASRPGSEWAEHVCADPRVSLAVSESAPPLRRVLARGCVTEVEDPGGSRLAAVETQLAARYAGFDAAREPAGVGRGRLLRLVPERLIAWRGLLRYPKRPPRPDSPDAAPWRHLG